MAALAFVAMLGLSGSVAMAQQTIVIGDDKPTAQGGAPVQGNTSGVVVNDDVLNSLGGPGASAPALPPMSPYAVPSQATQQPLAESGAPGTAYRLPDTGQLVISRPSTLLFPPQVFPTSRLTVPAPAGSAARAAAPRDSGTAQSRLMVPKPAEPAAPQIAQPKAMETMSPSASAVPREPVTQAPAPSAAIAELPPVADSPAAAAPVEEPTPPPEAPLAPMAEPVLPAAPQATTSLPTTPAPAAEPPAPSTLTTDLQSSAPRETPTADSAPSTTAPGGPANTPAPAPAQPTQSAALTPAAGSIGETRVVFDDGSAELSAAASSQLAGVANDLMNNAEARVQLLAYAKGSEVGTSRARRLSLSRALAVRAYLIEKGVRSTRMDVRALGSGFEDGPPDRVDILPIASTQ